MVGVSERGGESTRGAASAMGARKSVVDPVNGASNVRVGLTMADVDPVQCIQALAVQANGDDVETLFPQCSRHQGADFAGRIEHHPWPAPGPEAGHRAHALVRPRACKHHAMSRTPIHVIEEALGSCLAAHRAQ